MNLNEKSPENLLVKALLIVVFSAVITAALSNEKWITVFKNFIAGVCGGVVIYLILSSTSISETWLLVCCCAMSAFISSLWPLMGSIAKTYIKKKSESL